MRTTVAAAFLYQGIDAFSRCMSMSDSPAPKSLSIGDIAFGVLLGIVGAVLLFTAVGIAILKLLGKSIPSV
jgi:hypothetical protein